MPWFSPTRQRPDNCDSGSEGDYSKKELTTPQKMAWYQKYSAEDLSPRCHPRMF
jgi:hypothetical protein